MPPEKKSIGKDQSKRRQVNSMIGRARSFIRRNADQRLIVESMKNTPNFYLDVQKNQVVIKSKHNLCLFKKT